MNIVLDTNVLVSALWSPNKKPSIIVLKTISRRFTACYNSLMLDEYNNVLYRPKFGFDKDTVSELIDSLTKNGQYVVPEPLPDINFTDESDKKFYEVALSCKGTLVTGNIRHYPADPCVMTVADFYDRFCI